MVRSIPASGEPSEHAQSWIDETPNVAAVDDQYWARPWNCPTRSVGPTGASLLADAVERWPTTFRLPVIRG